MRRLLIFGFFILTSACSTKDKPVEFFPLTEAVEKATDCDSIRKDAGRLLEMAEEYRGNWNYGNAIFIANLSLGYCAISQGDAKAAEDYLAKAVATPGSPQLNSAGLLGFDMRLPKALLKRDRKESVLKFLDESKRFWAPKFSDVPIAKWKSEISAGKIPEFQRSEFNTAESK